jgi:hypothetical protein
MSYREQVDLQDLDDQVWAALQRFPGLIKWGDDGLPWAWADEFRAALSAAQQQWRAWLLGLLAAREEQLFWRRMRESQARIDQLKADFERALEQGHNLLRRAYRQDLVRVLRAREEQLAGNHAAALDAFADALAELIAADLVRHPKV